MSKDVNGGDGRNATGAEVRRVCWLGPDLFLVIGRFGDHPNGPVPAVAAAAAAAGKAWQLDACTWPLETARPHEPAERILAARFPEGRIWAEVDSMKLRVGDNEHAVAFDVSAAETSEWQALVDEALGDRDMGYRYGALGTILRVARPSLSGLGGFTLAVTLKAIRDALIPRMPYASMQPNEPQAVAVDKVLAIDERSFWISGWVHDAEGYTTRLTAVSPEGVRSEMFETAFRFPRPDIQEVYSAALDVTLDEHGYICFCELDTPSLVPGGWTAELATPTRRHRSPAR